MDYDEIRKRALAVRGLYDQLNRQTGTPEWQTRDYLTGLVGDIGDLSKLIMAKNGVRAITDVDAKLAHELSDCLWSLIVLADKLEIDLGTSFMATMDELENRLTAK